MSKYRKGVHRNELMAEIGRSLQEPQEYGGMYITGGWVRFKLAVSYKEALRLINENIRRGYLKRHLMYCCTGAKDHSGEHDVCSRDHHLPIRVVKITYQGEHKAKEEHEKNN